MTYVKQHLRTSRKGKTIAVRAHTRTEYPLMRKNTPPLYVGNPVSYRGTSIQIVRRYNKDAHLIFKKPLPKGARLGFAFELTGEDAWADTPYESEKVYHSYDLALYKAKYHIDRVLKEGGVLEEL